MASRVILLKYLARFCDAVEVGQYLQLGLHCDKTALILKRTKTHSISIQGYPEIPFSEKNKAWFTFQQAVKDLLGIPKDSTICIRFSDAPQRIVGSLSTLFTEPRYLIDLVVHPVNSPSSISKDAAVISTGFDEVDSSVFPMGKSLTVAGIGRRRRSFNLGLLERQRRAELAREVSTQEDLNRLYNQLADLSICLQRTQLECEAIAKRCDSQETRQRSLTSSFKKEIHGRKRQKKAQYSVSFSSSVSSESGKGSMVESELVDSDDDNIDAPQPSTSHPLVPMRETNEESLLLKDEGEDEKIERILKVAESLANQFQVRASGSSVLSEHQLPPSDQVKLPKQQQQREEQHEQKKLPDVPTCVCVRPSFKHGGAYVMWDPVSLNGEDCNHGHKVLGYNVHLDGKLHCFADGSLSSQVELDGMVNACEYGVQVCTVSEKVNSPLTPLLTYKHLETNRPSQDTSTSSSSHSSPARNPSTAEALSSAFAKFTSPSSATGTPDTTTLKPTQFPPHSSSLAQSKVHSWLKESLAEFPVMGNNESADAVQPPNPTRNTTSLHVHFEDDENVCMCSGDDDAKSIGSSHTSGIVTDFPASPKLVSSCSCRHCCHDKPSMKGKSVKFDVPIRSRCESTHSSSAVISPKKTKLDCRHSCDSSPSRVGVPERRSSCENGDSVIDQPLYFGKEEEVSYLQRYSCSPATPAAAKDGLHSDYTLPGRSGHNGVEAKRSLLATYV